MLWRRLKMIKENSLSKRHFLLKKFAGHKLKKVREVDYLEDCLE